MKTISKEDPIAQRYSVSTLRLRSLRTAYDAGLLEVRTSDMDRVMEEGEMHTPFASHVESNYLFSKDYHFRERYTRSNTN